MKKLISSMVIVTMMAITVVSFSKKSYAASAAEYALILAVVGVSISAGFPGEVMTTVSQDQFDSAKLQVTVTDEATGSRNTVWAPLSTANITDMGNGNYSLSLNLSATGATRVTTTDDTAGNVTDTEKTMPKRGGYMMKDKNR